VTTIFENAGTSPITTRVVGGRFRGSDGRYLWLERDGTMIGIETADVDHLTRETSYWAAGAITGAALDAIALLAIAAALNNATAHTGD